MSNTKHQIIKNISHERFLPYLNIAKQNEAKALLAYEFNIRLAESFYPILHNLEISLRNIFNQKIQEIYGQEWLLNKKLILGTNQKELDNLEKVNQIIKKFKTENQSTIISNLSLGFWLSLLYPNYEISLWRPALRNAFSYQNKITRRDVQNKLRDVKFIRNRIAHHECILKLDLKFYHNNAGEILRDIAPENLEFTNKIDRFNEILKEWEDYLGDL